MKCATAQIDHGTAMLQVQVLAPEAAAAHPILSVAKHGPAQLPVMYFGTLEVGWVSLKATLSWAAGIAAQKHRLKRKQLRFGFPEALEQVNPWRPFPVDQPPTCFYSTACTAFNPYVADIKAY